jgi:hypothetical protein
MIGGTTLNSTSALGAPTLVYTNSGGAVGNAVVNNGAGYAAASTSIVIDNGAGAASSITLVAGDRVTFGGSTNGGIGYRITAVTTTLLTITPGLQDAILDNASITAVATGAAVGATTILESGQVIEFNIAAALTEEVPSVSSKSYVLLADTTTMKTTATQSTATSQVRMLGSKADATGTAADGLTWSYLQTADGLTSGSLTISDSYIVSGKSLLYQ